MFDCCAAIVNFRRIQCLNDVDFRRSKQTACLVSRTSVSGDREWRIYGVNTRSRRRPNGADAPYEHHVAERGVASCCRVPRDRRSRSQSHDCRGGGVNDIMTRWPLNSRRSRETETEVPVTDACRSHRAVADSGLLWFQL